MTTALEDPNPLKLDYLPQEFVDRKDEKTLLSDTFSSITDSSRNLFIHGPRGTGKTHLLLKYLNRLPDSVTTCYVPGTRYDTQYKALEHLFSTATGEHTETGYHSADLKRNIEERIQTRPTVIVLDDIDFLLMNDGDDLLYYLSRSLGDLSVITISANHANIHEPLEERTYSSLYPQRIEFEPYTAEQVYRILVERARKSLTEQSLRREALTYIASTTQNVSIALTWLKAAAETADNIITDTTVQDAQDRAFQSYIDYLLDDFTEHHRLLFQGIQELTTEQDSLGIRTGKIYDRYQNLCRTYSEDSLSSRRIGTYLKHLELLNFVEADYHYGGSKGKTREVRLGSQIDGTGVSERVNNANT